jgi:MFS transporter, ACS family, tartrate transporter
VNSIGNLGGFGGPYVVGWIKDGTGTFVAGLYFLAACAPGSGIVALLAVRPALVPARPVGLEPAE